MFHDVKTSPKAPTPGPIPNPGMRVMLSRQAEMHRILLDEHVKLQKSHQHLCEKLLSETRRLMMSNNNHTDRNRTGTFTRSSAATTSSSSTVTRIPRSISLKKISSKSVMDLRVLAEPAVASHHRSQVNLAHNDHESDDHDDGEEHVSGTRESHAVEDHVNELKQQLVLVVDQLRESKDQNELLEFRIFELEKMNEELIEQSSSSPSSSSAGRKYNNDVICTGQCPNQDCLSVRERLEVLETREKDLIEENMKLQMEVVALKDELSLLMESRDPHQMDHTELRRTASHQMSSSEDEGLADLEVRMRRDSVNDRDRDSPAEGVESSASSSASSSSSSSYCPIINNSSSAGSIAGSESGISGSLFLDNGTQTESEDFPAAGCEAGQEKSAQTPSLSSSAGSSPDPPPPSSSSPVPHSPSSDPPVVGDVSSQIILSVTTECHCQKDAAGDELMRENAMLKEVNQQLSQQRDSLTEQVLELEEAENDARSLSQKLQTQVTSLVNQMESLQIMLVQERESLQKKEALIKQYEDKVKEFLNTQSKEKAATSGNSDGVSGRTVLAAAAASRCSSSSAGSTTGSNESIDSVSDYALTAGRSIGKGSSSGGRAGGSIWNKIHRFEKKIRIRIKSNLTVNGKKEQDNNHTHAGTPGHVSSIAIRDVRRSEPEEGLLDDEEDGSQREAGDEGSGAGIRDAAVAGSVAAEASGADEEEGRGVDDLQMFISEKDMMKQNIGSTFDPKNYLPSRKNRHLLLTSTLSSPAHHQHQQQQRLLPADSESQHPSIPQTETPGVAAAFQVAQGHDASSLRSTSSSLPLCETIKPLRIDINNRHQSNMHVQQHPPPSVTTSAACIASSSGGRNVIINISNKRKADQAEPARTSPPDDPEQNKLPPALLSGNNSFNQMSHRLVKLEQNERLLRDKLIKLEWINKEFVHELELRERILNSKEADHKELQLIKSTFSHEVQRIQSQLNQVKQQQLHERELSGANEYRESLDCELTQLHDRERQLISEMQQKESEFNLIKKSFEEKRKKLESEHEAVAVNLMVRMKDMETESALTVRQLEEQRRTIYHELEACVREFHLKEVVMSKKISSLEQELSALQSKQAADCCAIQSLRDELRGSREREAAFKETINRADQIIFDAEKGYKERIDGLRESEVQLCKKIERLEEELEEVKYSSSSASCYSSSSNDHASLEISLRECITRLEESEHSMKNKIKRLENERNELLIELQENEQVINKNTHLQREHESLKKEFAFLKSYKSDLEDLLKSQAEAFAQKETDLVKQINTLKKERDSFQVSLSHLRQDMEQRLHNKACFTTEHADGNHRVHGDHDDDDDDEVIENSRL